MSIKWTGVFPAVTTKFTANDELDFEAFDLNIEAQLEAGAEGIILGGSLGEASVLSDEEKFGLLSHTLSLVNGRVPVLLNIAEATTKKAIEAAKKAESLGANGLMLLPPMRYNAAPDETLAFFGAICRKYTAADYDLQQSCRLQNRGYA
ncbi:dihydrodipicolinate synthase family protein [Pedobacter miscanthi]|uniref:dihydrodipicolinate synthase family protein n=1 Tax=Pedobacter miscanthi TaxID=2259170 RepID=UPI001FCA4792|nr:dihydrodipicolinate synthase family protein [Pedobacter miscanthi]